MKIVIMKKSLIPIILLVVFVSCSNKDMDFPDYEYQTVYFAYQYPVRTITFGEDVFNTDSDNQGKCQIMATTGGVYYSKKDLHIGIAVDQSLLGSGLRFGAGKDEIVGMPVDRGLIGQRGAGNRIGQAVPQLAALRVEHPDVVAGGVRAG